ncbi:MAG: class I SAM-dependent methyltransferase [Chitinophagaceae bacterium]
MRFTQQVPNQSAIGSYYKSENYISHTNTKKGFINRLYHIVRKRTLNQKRDLIERVTGLRKGNLLDVGSGTGAFARHMQDAGWKVSALEPDEDTRRRAFDLYGLSLSNMQQLFSFPPGIFDAITLWHVLEHVHDLHEYLEQVRNVLSDDGKAFIAVPNYTSYDASVYGQYWAAYDVPRHLYHFSPASMKQLLEKHGLKQIAIQPMWYDSFYVSLLSEQNKSGSANYSKALGTAIKSNWKTVWHNQKCSSLIYVIEKF